MILIDGGLRIGESSDGVGGRIELEAMEYERFASLIMEREGEFRVGCESGSRDARHEQERRGHDEKAYRDAVE